MTGGRELINWENEFEYLRQKRYMNNRSCQSLGPLYFFVNPVEANLLFIESHSENNYLADGISVV